MEMGNAQERAMSLRQRIQNGEKLSTSIADLKDILADDCAELDKAKVA